MKKQMFISAKPITLWSLFISLLLLNTACSNDDAPIVLMNP